MRILRDVSTLKSWRKNQDEIGFVPTMGALHSGHMSLINKSKQVCDTTLVSVFINPAQFDQESDLAGYPQNLMLDTQLLEAAGVDALYLPDYEQIYPDDYRFKVAENSFSKQFCGAHRPGHFDGVLTVVMKLFNLTLPTYAFFGEKDYQQLQLIKDMVAAFFMSVDVIACPTIRDEDGFALSSRNQKLTTEELNLAPMFYQTLIDEGDLAAKKTRLHALGFKVEYLSIYENRLLAAVHLGGVRLIDNVPWPGDKSE